MDAFLTSANIRLLRDEAVLLGGEVYLYGRPDAQRPGRGVEVRKTPAELVEGTGYGQAHSGPRPPAARAGGAGRGGRGRRSLRAHARRADVPGNLTVRLFWENACGCLPRGVDARIVTSGASVLSGRYMRVATRAEICPITIHFMNGKGKRFSESRFLFLIFSPANARAWSEGSAHAGTGPRSPPRPLTQTIPPTAAPSTQQSDLLPATSRRAENTGSRSRPCEEAHMSGGAARVERPLAIGGWSRRRRE